MTQGGVVMGYGTVARLLHWIMALLILAMIPAGLTMVQEDLPRPVQDALFIFHKNTGSLLLVLVIVRIIWRAFHPAPPLPDHMPVAMRAAARTTHYGLYLAVLTMAVSGYSRVRLGGFPIEYLDAMGVPPLLPKNEPAADVAKAIHATVKYALISLIALHVAAASYHGLVRRDGVFGRMWPPVAPRQAAGSGSQR